jgi:ribulose-phosphate 3-epimerase
MAQIIPAVIGQTYSEVERQLKILEGYTDWVHLDVTDGYFTPAKSWNAIEDLRFLEGKAKIEVHLMVEKPEEIVRDWAEVVDRIIIHHEATDHFSEILEAFSLSVVKIGVAFLLPTSIEALVPYLPKINLVHLMSIAEIGEQGHPFDARVLEKVKHLRSLAPNVIIQLDGGVNLETAKLALEAGVDNLIIGSAIWQTPNPIISLQSLQSLLPKS